MTNSELSIFLSLVLLSVALADEIEQSRSDFPAFLRRHAGRHENGASVADMDETPPPPTNPFYNCPSSGGFFAISSDACLSNYYACVNGIAYVLTCPGNGLFDPITSNCLSPGEVSCKDSIFKCPAAEGFFGVGDCSPVYFVCFGGEATEKICPGGGIFDPSKGACSTPSSVSSCSTTTAVMTSPSTAETTTSTGANTTSTTEHTTTSKTPGSFQCPPKDGSYPDPNGDCAAYFVCVSGVAYPSTCISGTCFNPDTMKCE